MRFFGSALVSLLLIALIWAALHDILRGEPDLTLEYAVMTLSSFALAGLVYLLTKRRSTAKKIKQFGFLLLLSAGIASPSALNADSFDHKDRLHLGFTLMPIGTGWPKASTKFQHATRSEFSIGLSNHWITIAGGISGLWDSSTDMDINSPSSPDDENSFWDIGLLYGRRLSEGEDGYIYAAAGLARTNIKIKRFRMIYSNSGIWEDNNDQEYTVWGFPIELQAVAKLGHRFGFVACLFENFNEKKSFGGLTVGFRIGP